jgi:hypothetical protein
MPDTTTDAMPYTSTDPDELPHRPRRRLLGTGGNPLQVALLGVLLLACGFIGGVLVEKSQTTAAGATAGAAASRLAALRGFAAGGAGARESSGAGASGAGANTNAGSASGGSAGAEPGFGGGPRGRAGGGLGGATIGEVAYISGDTLYVSGFEGNTVKVKTSAASSVTKTVKTSVHDIHPGDTVVVRGTKSAGGALSAESVSVNGGGGALGGLFGGGGSEAGAARRGSGAAGGEPTLFGR